VLARVYDDLFDSARDSGTVDWGKFGEVWSGADDVQEFHNRCMSGHYSKGEEI
jgi:hypothetical protein